MTTDRYQSARLAAWALLVHTVAVMAAVGGKYLLLHSGLNWPGERLLRLADLPVLPVIDWVMQNFSLPPRWFYPRLRVALALNEALAYAVVGGAFYSAAVATVSFIHARIRTVKQE